MSVIRIVYISFPFIALLAGIYSFKFLNKNLRLILLYVLVGFGIEILMWYLAKRGIRNNMPGLHFYVMFEFLVWFVFYFNNLKGFVKSKYMLASVILFEAYCIINMIFIQKLTEYPGTRSIEDIFLIIYSVLFFTKVMSEAKIIKLAHSPFIWINMAVLIYFAGNFFYNVVFINLLEKNSQFLRTISLYFFATFNSLYYIGIAVGFILNRSGFFRKQVT